MIRFAREHLLATVLTVAIILRIVAVIFSQGYMAHDDHFEVISIAWEWHHEGVFLDDGTLRWEGKPEIGAMRSTVYNMMLLGLMKLTSAFGIENLDQHMYFDRLFQALFSLLPVIIGFKYLRNETSRTTAVAGGLLLSAHFLMPFLSVRDLIETGAANLMLPALYCVHVSVKGKSDSKAAIGAVLAAIAFQFRFQTGLMIAPIPIAVLLMNRDWRRAIVFTVAFLVSLSILGLWDLYTHGVFLGGVYAHVLGNLTQPAPITEPWYNFTLLFLGIFIPPFSILFLATIFRRDVIRKHIILWLPTIVFFAVHSLFPGKQERFMIPILPVVMVLGCVGMYNFFHDSRFRRWRSLQIGLIGWFAALNLILLVPFTFNYGHRGFIGVMVYLSRQDDVDSAVFDSSERREFLPYSYWDYRKPNSVELQPPYRLDDAIAAGRVSQGDPPSYYVVFADGYPDSLLAQLSTTLGKYKVVYHGKPSLVDEIVHRLNPKYNAKNEAWVLRLK